MAAALGAALWLLGLLAAAPVLSATRARAGTYGTASRLRDALVLGVAIPFGLGLVHALYPLACWLVLATLIATAFVKSGNRLVVPLAYASKTTPLPLILIAALALVAWPQLMRPVLDGDTLWYHLPNAAAWSHAHSLWTTDSRYWYYPPASELFASALYTVAGPFAIGWSGAGAIALIGLRVVDMAREEWQLDARVADALGAAVVTVSPIALQAGSLQNDVWLAAFFVESLWTLRHEPAASMRALAVTALIKPYGFIFAGVAALTNRAPRNAWLAGAGALALWAAHDVALWHAAIVAPAKASQGNGLSTSVLAHGLPALGLLGRVTLEASPLALLALLMALAAPVSFRERGRAIAWSAFAALGFFLIMPLAYEDYTPQLATGASLRYAAPAIAAGALLLASPAAALAIVALVVFIASSAFGSIGVLAIFWNDAPTRTALGVAPLALACVALGRRFASPWPLAAGLSVAIVIATFFAARDPVAFYTDTNRVDGKATALYAWIARERPAAIGSADLHPGIVNVLSPQTRTVDLSDADPCTVARKLGVLLVTLAENDRSRAFNDERLTATKTCGTVLFEDGIGVVTSPANRAK